MKPLKLLICGLTFLALLGGGVQAEDKAALPQRLTLIFDDRLLTLDFRTHPDLLQPTINLARYTPTPLKLYLTHLRKLTVLSYHFETIFRYIKQK